MKLIYLCNIKFDIDQNNFITTQTFTTMKVLLAPELIVLTLGAMQKAGIKVNDVSEEKFSKFFMEGYTEVTEALDKMHPSIVVRFLLAMGKTKKEVGKIIRKDSSDISSMMTYRSFLGDPSSKGQWTQKDLANEARYKNLRWTEDEFNELQAAHPAEDEDEGWKLSKVRHLMLGIPEGAENQTEDEAAKANAEPATATA